jgi:predicted nucleic acid-binding Zn ribbon protein
MPIRELRCKDCGYRWDALIRNDEDLEAERCPAAGCKGGEIEIMFASGVAYKWNTSNGASVTPKKFRGGK